jgi:hypothetical protein
MVLSKFLKFLTMRTYGFFYTYNWVFYLFSFSSVYCILAIGLDWFWKFGEFKNANKINTILINLSYSYIAALLFFIFNDYIPRRIASKKALGVLGSQISKIHADMSRLISTIKMILNIDKEDVEITLKDLYQLSSFNESFEKNYFECTPIINNVVSDNKTRGVFFYKEFKSSAENIIKNIQKLAKDPLFMYLEKDLVELISRMLQNKFLVSLKQTHNLSSSRVWPYALDESFYNYIQEYFLFEKYKFRKTKYKFKKLTHDQSIELQSIRKEVIEEVRQKIVNIKKGKFIKNGIEYRILNGEVLD